MNDFTPNRLSFDVYDAMSDITEIIEICLDELSVSFQEIIRRQIIKNGNGSGQMKDEALRHVKEISRKVTNRIVELEVGVDEDIGDERSRIRTVVVLHGNLNSGPLFTKPGRQTWRKHVSYKDTSTAKSVYHLDNLMQLDISGKLLQNSMDDVEKHCNKFLSDVTQAFSTIDLSDYIIVG